MAKNGFTTDEVQTATLMYTEGYAGCHKVKRWKYPAMTIRMCVKEALEPASRVFGRKINPARSKKIICPPDQFPPDGKGAWEATTTGKELKKTLDRLSPLIPKYYIDRWKKRWKDGNCPLE